MLTLPESAQRVGTPDFASALQRELAALPEALMPITGDQGGRVDPSSIGVTLLSVQVRADHILADIGVFFTETVGGCSCGDEPFVSQGYRELTLTIDPETGATVCAPRDRD
jgi:hypothetical protein